MKQVEINNDWVYDIETFPNVFTIAFEHLYMPLRVAYEISDQVNDSDKVLQFCSSITLNGGRMFGFNNLGFDYPVVHALLKAKDVTAKTLYDKAMAIIGGQKGFGDEENEKRFLYNVKPSDRLVEQIDVFKIMHFDNRSKATSLKVLEFNMRSDNIEDLPFPVGTDLTPEQIEVLKAYNAHDVSETKKFIHHVLPMIKFREELCQKYPGKDWMNFNDTKIGKEYFIMRLEESGVKCYDFGQSGRQPKQTKRPSIALNEAILPWIRFEDAEFNRVLDWLRQQTITETKGVFDDVTATVNGFTFVFGLGGIHGSVESEVIEAEDEMIVDWDVTSMYPNIAIKNGFFPYHLGEKFCEIYSDLFEQRKSYGKKTAENAMLKLALNGVYGDSNNKFSVFYDPLYTMATTLNGQLQLCLLAEQLMKIPGLMMIQANTDGLTFKVAKHYRPTLDSISQWWQAVTKLNLEEAQYRTMAIADVNSYIGVYLDGSVKRKGRYEWDLEWHQNAGALVVAKVAEKVLVDRAPIRETVENWPDIMDFMLRAKVPRSSKLMFEHPGVSQQQLQNTTRYYVAKGGGHLVKVMPPLAKKPNEWRRIGIESGWGVQPCNDIRDAGKLPVDFDYYIKEVEKLCLALK